MDLGTKYCLTVLGLLLRHTGGNLSLSRCQLVESTLGNIYHRAVWCLLLYCDNNFPIALCALFY